jgi:hypothetical protein
MADTASVSLFDNKKYGNQKATDGNKLIFDSGYFYTPVLYGTGNDNRLYFENVGDSPTYRSTANFLSSSYYVSGSPILGFPIVTIGGSQYVSKLYNNVIERPEDLDGGTSTAFPVYTVPEGGSYTISANLTMTMKSTNYGTASFTLQTYLNGSTYGTGDTQVFEFLQPSSSYTSYGGTYVYSDAGTIIGTPVTSVKPITVGSTTYPTGTTFYRYYETFHSFVDTGTCNSTGVIFSTGYSFGTPSFGLSNAPGACFNLKRPIGAQIINIPDFNVLPGEQTFTKTFNVNFRSSTTLTAGNTISASLKLNSISSALASNYTASIDSDSQFQITSLSSLTGNYPYTALSPFGYFTPPESSDLPYLLAENQLAFSPGLTSFYSPGYQFIPYWVSGSSTYSSSLYPQYGDVDYPFQLGVFDIFSAYDMSGSYFETRIADVQKITGISGSNQYIIVTFTNNIPDDLGGPSGQLYDLSDNKATKFLFIKRVPDETSAYLKFQKRPGQTSYGFLIPDNLAKDVLDNIDTITKQVKQKLVNDQGSVIGDINGGGF